MTILEAYEVFRIRELLDRKAKPSTIKNYYWAVHSLTGAVGDIDINFLGVDHIISWKVRLREDGKSVTSINGMLSKIRSLLRWLNEHEMRVLDPSVIKREPEPRNRPKTFLTAAEVGQLKSAAKFPRNLALVSLYFATGCRLSELLDLDRADFEEAKLVDTDRLIYEVWVCGKGGKYRPVYFDELTRQTVEDYLDTRTDRFKPLFVSRQNRRLGGSMVEKMIHDLTRRAGLDKHVTPHTLRHSYTSDLIINGAPISAVSELLGHAKQSTTLNIYSHINSHQKIDAYARSHTQ